VTASSTARRRLAEMGIAWPPVPPTHQYVPAVRFGQMVFVSGHAPYADGTHQYRGRVGETLDLDQARSAARLAVLGCLVSLESALGSLDNIERVLKVNGYVHCVPGYEPLPKVTDAASELLIELFAAAGQHARTTVGVASLPSGVAVELELLAIARYSTAQELDRGDEHARPLPSGPTIAVGVSPEA
jgi:enamine deaminase RidA (YjgF/YER057c/UK114 family)